MKSYEVCNAKGKRQLRVFVTGKGLITVVWEDGVAMTFRGPASVIVGTLIVPVSADGVDVPKSMLKTGKPMESVKFKKNGWFLSTIEAETILHDSDSAKIVHYFSVNNVMLVAMCFSEFGDLWYSF